MARGKKTGQSEQAERGQELGLETLQDRSKTSDLAEREAAGDLRVARFMDMLEGLLLLP